MVSPPYPLCHPVPSPESLVSLGHCWPISWKHCCNKRRVIACNGAKVWLMLHGSSGRQYSVPTGGNESTLEGSRLLSQALSVYTAFCTRGCCDWIMNLTHEHCAGILDMIVAYGNLELLHSLTSWAPLLSIHIYTWFPRLRHRSDLLNVITWLVFAVFIVTL